MKNNFFFYRLLYKIHVSLAQMLEKTSSVQLEDEWIDREDVKKFLKISDSTYKRIVKEGIIEPYKFPGGDRFLKREFLQQLEKTKYSYKVRKSKG